MTGTQRPDSPVKSSAPELRPPASLSDGDAAAQSRFPAAFWLALVALLGAALAVVILLPRYAQQSPAVPAAQGEQTGAPVAAPASRPGSDSRPLAEQGLRDFLQLRARLELDNAPVWGKPEWDHAAADVQQGDRLFVQHDYGAAEAAYRRAIAKLEALETSRPERLATALSQGQQALEEGRAADAAARFDYALAIDPQNAQALLGLQRSGVRNEVLALMSRGEQAEEQGELEAAQAAYSRAAELDAAYQPAKQAQQRVAPRIEQAAFRVAMDEAVQALEEGRYTVAEQALRSAAGLRPDDVSLRDLRHRLEVARTQATLAGLRRQAAAQVAREAWQDAMRTYEQALKVDAAVAFAVAGKQRARERLRLHGQIDHYLAEPARLASDEPLANAEQVVQAAGDVSASEPRLADKLAQLRRLVAQARIPVNIELRSDGQTEVVIYHVGRRGRFLQQQLQLRPGTYTVVGSRPGHRDVRKQFVVKPGMPPPVVTIRCEERI